MFFSRKKDMLEQNLNNSSKSLTSKNPLLNQRDDGPPNLDEVFDKFKEAFTNKKKPSFSNNNGDDDSSTNSPTLNFSSKTIIYILIIAIFIWLASGFYIVNPAERGVVLRFGNYIKTAIPGPNWHFPYPISEVYIVDVDQIRNVEIGYRTARNTQSTSSSITSESLMLTNDENIVDLKFAVQYRVSDAQYYLFNVKDPDLTLTQAVESAIRETVGKNTLNFVLTSGRDQVAQNTRDLSQEILDFYKSGISITSINLQDVQPPEQVQDAFNDAVRAREDQQKLINEAEAYSNDIIPKARGLAARMVEEAEAYSSQVKALANGEAERFISIYNAYKQTPDVTKKRLFIETMQQVLQNTSKVVIDSDNASVINLLGSPSQNPGLSPILFNSTPALNSQPVSNGQNTPASGFPRSSSDSGSSRLQRVMQRITGNN